METLKLFDTVATLKPLSVERLKLVEPNHTAIQSLPTGQVGTIVEVYEELEESRYLIEFADLRGHEYAMAILKADELLILHYELVVA